MLESVAALRVATCFLTKWYYFYKIKSKFLHSQSGSNTSEESTVSPMMNKFEQSLRQYKKISSDSSTNILSFFLKSLYFHTGYGDLVSWLISNVKAFDSLKKVNIFNIITALRCYLYAGQEHFVFSHGPSALEWGKQYLECSKFEH